MNPLPAIATAAITVTAPQPSGALLSMAAPGAGQFYLGNPAGGAVWLGLGAAAGYGTFSLIWSGTENSKYMSPLEDAAGGLAIAAGAGAWLGVCAISTLVAAAEISGKYGPAEEVFAAPPPAASAPGTRTMPTPRPGPRRGRGED